MTLWVHLTDPESQGQETIAKHAWSAALREFERSAAGVTAQKIADHFSLTAGEKTELTNWYTNTYLVNRDPADEPTGTINAHVISDAFLLVESGFYTSAEAKARMGM